MPVSIGSSVTVDTPSRSKITIAPTTISKMGRLTLPTSGYQRYGFSHTSQIPLPRNPPVPLIPSHHQNPFPLRISHKFISNLHSAISQPPQTNGCLRIILPLWKHRRRQQNPGTIGTQWITSPNMVLFPTLSTNGEETGRRNAISKKLWQRHHSWESGLGS